MLTRSVYQPRVCTNQECVYTNQECVLTRSVYKLTRSVLYVTFVEDSDDGSPKGSPSLHGHLMKEKQGEDNVDVDKEGDEDKGETGQLPSLTSKDSLSHEVFSNLPEDLQEILRSSSFICKCDLCVCSCVHAYVGILFNSSFVKGCVFVRDA